MPEELAGSPPALCLQNINDKAAGEPHPVIKAMGPGLGRPSGMDRLRNCNLSEAFRNSLLKNKIGFFCFRLTLTHVDIDCSQRYDDQRQTDAKSNCPQLNCTGTVHGIPLTIEVARCHLFNRTLGASGWRARRGCLEPCGEAKVPRIANGNLWPLLTKKCAHESGIGGGSRQTLRGRSNRREVVATIRLSRRRWLP